MSVQLSGRTTTIVHHALPAETSFSARELLTLGFSWFLVTAIGLMPLADAALGRTSLIATPTMIVVAVALGSAVVLRRRYSWLGLVLHIYGQIAIWLSLFVMSLAWLLFIGAR